MNKRNVFTYLLCLLIASVYIGCDSDYPENEAYSESKQFSLFSVSNPSIKGSALFSKRNDGSTVIAIQLEGTTAGINYPAHIHTGSAASNGSIIINLNPINGATGKSETTIKNLNNGSPIAYAELLNLDAHINVHQSPTDLTTIVSQGDIGINQLTSTSKTYPLNSASNPAISGSVKFTKRVSGKTLVSISLVGTSAGVLSIAHLHKNSVAQTGEVVADLSAVNGLNGKSETSLNKLNNGSDISYDELLNYNGYVNVHLNANAMATIIAQGNIGSNVSTSVPTPSTSNYNVTNSGSSSYIFNDSGLVNANNPNITLQRGKTYTFNLNAPGHPFLIKTSRTTGSSNNYNTGVTNNGATSGVITFVVPSDAPSTLFYICEFHSSMAGIITITN